MMVLRMVEKIIAQAPVHRNRQVVTIACLLHKKIFFGEEQNLIPMLASGFDVQADDPFVVETGHAPGLAVNALDR